MRDLAGFPRGALISASPGAEEATSPQAAVLRSSIYYSGLPQKGWMLVLDSPSEQAYVAPTGGPLAYAEADLKLEAGVWQSSYASCNLMAVPPPGYSATTWTLASAPDLAATDIHVFVTIDCRRHEYPADFVASVSADGSSVEVGVFEGLDFADRVMAKTSRCWDPDTDQVLTTIHLDEPMGARDLFDAGPWPRVQKSSAGQIVPPTPDPTRDGASFNEAGSQPSVRPGSGVNRL